MATTNITLSIPLELGQFLEENPVLSPSKIMQSKLFEIKNEEYKFQERLKAAETKMFRVSGKLNKVLEYCESKNFEIPQNVLE